MKRQHPDALLLFRMGDFYECFDDDARAVSEALGIALTSRPMGRDEGRVPLAGIPHQSLERHLDRLLAAGHRVAICEQTSPPGHGLVERRVVRVVTPGTVDGGALLAEREHNWLVAVAPPGAGERRYGLAACDVTTGELECQLVAAEALDGEWERLRPSELLLPEGVEAPALDGAAMVRRAARDFDPARAAEALARQLGVAGLEPYGLEGLEPAVGAAGALLAYVAATYPGALPHLRPPRAVRQSESVALDARTRRNLELFEGAGGGSDGSLVAALDRTLTPMGGRLLRARLGRPLRSLARIEARLDRVQAFVREGAARRGAREAARRVPDLERLLGRVRAGTATAQQLVTLRRGLERLPVLAAEARAAGAALAPLADELGAAAEAAGAIAATLADEPPGDVADGGTVRDGFDERIDALRALTGDAREALGALETAERDRTGVSQLKLGYHRVFGYYLELPQSRADRAPADWERRQTLVAAERFRSPALGELERRMLGARDELETAEREVLDRLRAQLAEAGGGIERAAAAAARVDVAAALAEVAVEAGYVRPQLTEGGSIAIEGGRHPVVERGLPAGAFVPNETLLGDGADVVVLTGPNMGGKSTYLRQTALIVLLAQCGCFVSAASARLAPVDRIFARVGAQDEIAAGRSTFMVEMVETAAILHQATERSLVILDEIGRGTATHDGLAIARAVIEHLHHRPGGTPRTLFATHFHELVALARELPRVENRSLAVTEEGGEVVFLHRIVPGGADRAFGVHVAALAGLPRAVVARARELLHELESGPAALDGDGAAEGQLPLLGSRAGGPERPDALLAELAELDPDALTPLEALQRLYALRREARERLAVEG